MSKWPRKPLSEVCEVNPVHNGAERLSPDSEVSFVPMSAVDEVAGRIATFETRTLQAVAKGYTSFRDGDVLFAKITPCMENGKAAIARNLSRGIGFGSTEFHVLRPRPMVLAEWLFAFLRQPGFRALAKSNFTGTAGQQRVPTDFLKRVEIPVPPLAEQDRLVKLLDEARTLLTLRDTADKLTLNIAPSLFQHLFGDPVKNSAGWPISTVGDHLAMIEYGPRFYNEAYTESGTRIVRITDLDSSGNLRFEDMPRIEVDSQVREARQLKPGDFIFARSGATVGKVALIPEGAPPTIAGAYFIRFRFTEAVDPLFGFEFFRSPAIQGIIAQQSKQAAQPNFSGPLIKGLPLIMPPRPLQKTFAAQIRKLHPLLASQQNSRSQLDLFFNSALHNVFSGKI